MGTTPGPERKLKLRRVAQLESKYPQILHGHQGGSRASDILPREVQASILPLIVGKVAISSQGSHCPEALFFLTFCANIPLPPTQEKKGLGEAASLRTGGEMQPLSLHSRKR